MKLAIIKVINGNYSIHAEGITDVHSAITMYHGLCQTLWNAPDVLTATIKIIDEDLEIVGHYRESIKKTEQVNT